VGTRPAALVGGFLLASVLISCWISNTATALMLTPIAVGVVRAMADNGHEDRAFAAGLVLAVAYGASIGGMATPVGSPTNLIAMGYLNEQGIPLSFGQWMTLGVPVVLLMTPALFWLATRGLRPATAEDAARGRAVLAQALAALGPLGRAEKRVLAVFLLVAAAWMTRELVLVKLPGLDRLSDMGIALMGALALFLLPSGESSAPRLLDWRTAERIPWGIVLLFGGGLSVAAAMESTGLSDWLAGELQPLGGLAPLVVIAALLLVTLLATELMSNVASLTAMLPIVGALAAALGVNPLTAGVPGQHRRQPRLHAAGRHRPERHRLRDRLSQPAPDAGDRPRAQPGRRVGHTARQRHPRSGGAGRLKHRLRPPAPLDSAPSPEHLDHSRGRDRTRVRRRRRNRPGNAQAPRTARADNTLESGGAKASPAEGARRAQSRTGPRRKLSGLRTAGALTAGRPARAEAPRVRDRPEAHPAL
jgi:TRAP-type C4-dicarboxylate transport system permease large subunit